MSGAGLWYDPYLHYHLIYFAIFVQKLDNNFIYLAVIMQRCEKLLTDVKMLQVFRLLYLANISLRLFCMYKV